MRKNALQILLYVSLLSCQSGEQTASCAINELAGLEIFSGYDIALEEAKQQKKPVLIYFSSLSDRNCRVFEEHILTNACVQEKIESGFVFLRLYADDPASNEGLMLQSKFVDNASQPGWVILDEHERLAGVLEGSGLDLSYLVSLAMLEGDQQRMAAESESDKFLAFLAAGLTAIQNEDFLPLITAHTPSNLSDYGSLPENLQTLDFEFEFEKISEEKGNVIITVISSGGAEVFAPHQESDLFIPLAVVFEPTADFDLDGELEYPVPLRVKDEILDEFRLYYSHERIVFKQQIVIKTTKSFVIKGYISLSWIVEDAILAPVSKSFQLRVS